VDGEATLQHAHMHPLPEGRARRPGGSKAIALMASPFDEVLRPGMVIELQWKVSPTAVRYNWWFAIVHRLRGADEVELFFPQYARNTPDAGGTSLHGRSTINRLCETHMHGGLAGGVRVPSRAQVAQWWACLSSDAHDMHPTGSFSLLQLNEELKHSCSGPEDNPLQNLRTKFQEFTPEEQPATSLAHFRSCTEEEER